eukprot:TRINITY_DN9067_c0_g1_i1.p1 TRINITY_DN9067_c0_g1~~TRINITY_DN9067_c0_g1_i1.p1  ORF type:complete len:1043 (-),score=358.10 TRINITY_DN9067_c0_g1_i1:61-2979(-)
MEQIQRFRFDSCYPEETTQEQLYAAEVRQMVDYAFDGINASIFAYGNTGAGKTFTMQGNPTAPGVIPRVVADVLGSPRAAAAEICMSYLEIYNERVRDLLDSHAAVQQPAVGAAGAPAAPGNDQRRREKEWNGGGKANGEKDLPIIEDARKNVIIPGLTELKLTSVKDFEEAYESGCKNRTVGPTKLNPYSSRSHAILVLKLVSTRQPAEGAKQKKLSSKIYLIDLAGSEDNRRAENKGVRMTESTNINQSLFVLAKVVNALNKGQERVPYRDSKLTRLLKDSLGGSSMSLMIANIGPSGDQFFDTRNTLKFASKSRKIANVVVVNEEAAPSAEPAAPAPLSREEQLQQWRERMGRGKHQQQKRANVPRRKGNPDPLLSTMKIEEIVDRKLRLAAAGVDLCADKENVDPFSATQKIEQIVDKKLRMALAQVAVDQKTNTQESNQSIVAGPRKSVALLQLPALKERLSDGDGNRKVSPASRNAGRSGSSARSISAPITEADINDAAAEQQVTVCEAAAPPEDDAQKEVTEGHGTNEAGQQQRMQQLQRLQQLQQPAEKVEAFAEEPLLNKEKQASSGHYEEQQESEQEKQMKEQEHDVTKEAAKENEEQQCPADTLQEVSNAGTHMVEEAVADNEKNPEEKRLSARQKEEIGDEKRENLPITPTVTADTAQEVPATIGCEVALPVPNKRQKVRPSTPPSRKRFRQLKQQAKPEAQQQMQHSESAETTVEQANKPPSLLREEQAEAAPADAALPVIEKEQQATTNQQQEQQQNAKPPLRPTHNVDDPLPPAEGLGDEQAEENQPAPKLDETQAQPQKDADEEQPAVAVVKSVLQQKQQEEAQQVKTDKEPVAAVEAATSSDSEEDEQPKPLTRAAELKRKRARGRRSNSVQKPVLLEKQPNEVLVVDDNAPTAEQQLLQLLNGGTTEALLQLYGVGAQRAQIIVGCRPYDSVTDLVGKPTFTQRAVNLLVLHFA